MQVLFQDSASSTVSWKMKSAVYHGLVLTKRREIIAVQEWRIRPMNKNHC
jgi:hypothetical protein